MQSYRSNPTPNDLIPELRDLLGEYPFLAHRGPEPVRGALRVLRDVKVSVFEVEIAMDALVLEDLGVCA